MDSFPSFQDIMSGTFWTPSPPSLSRTIWIRVPVLEHVLCLKFINFGLIFWWYVINKTIISAEDGLGRRKGNK